MNPAPQFDRVHAAIRARLLSGEWPPGYRLDLGRLAEELGASITPVRDALYRLNGERLLAAGVHDGFAVPAITEPELCDLYAWHRDLLLLAQGQCGEAEWELGYLDHGALVERTVGLFRAIGASSPNPEHVVAIDATGDRLHSARLVEVRLGVASEDELRSLVEAAASGNALALRTRLELYHQRRMALAGRIVHALHRPETRT